MAFYSFVRSLEKCFLFLNATVVHDEIAHMLVLNHFFLVTICWLINFYGTIILPWEYRYNITQHVEIIF